MLSTFPPGSRNEKVRREEEGMAQISREEEARLAAEFEQEADDDEQWEEAPAPVQRSRGTLGTQVTIRLDPATAEKLREVASDRSVGYTSLLRGWIEERLNAEIDRILADQIQMTPAGESVETNAVHGSGEGEVKLVRLGAA
jgi:predicted transcriptional regulator